MTSETPPAPKTAPETAAAKQNRRFRLRLITFGEIVGVLALCIAGLAYWDQHRDHLNAERETAQEHRRAAVHDALLLRASGAGERLTLQPVAPDQTVQSQTILLPTELGGGPFRTTGESHIEKAWVEKGVLDARRRTGAKGDPGGDRRLPIGIETTYLTDGETRTDRAIYDLSYTVKSRFLHPDDVALQGLALVRREGGAGLRARLDRLWAERTAAETADALAAKPPPG